MSPPHALLVHAPKSEDRFGPLGRASSVNQLAVGLPALGAELERAGWSVELLHLGVQRRAEPGFELGAEAARSGARLVGLSLHWHPQTWDAVQAARAVKRSAPGAFVVAGGFTASLFHEELLREVPEVDAVVRGDGELPLVALARAVASGGPLAEVPNLSWREGGRIRVNPLSYVAGASQLAALDYERLDLLRHLDVYMRDFCGVHYVPRGRWALAMRAGQRLFGGGGRYFVLPAGRGCSVSCAWCGGGRGAHGLHSGRSGHLFLREGRLAALVARAVELGFRGVHACFDPTPADPSRWVEVFDRVRASGVRCELFFESFALPAQALLDAISRTFSRRRVAISPETPFEELRRRVRGLPFTDLELLDAVERCDRAGADVVLCFGCGLPFGGGDEVAGILALAARCRARMRRGRLLLRAFPIEMEPGAPWSLRPASFGIESTRASFADYLLAHTPGHRGPEAGLGYRRAGEAGGIDQVRERACRSLCPLPPSPELGHLTCRVLRLASGAAAEARSC